MIGFYANAGQASRPTRSLEIIVRGLGRYTDRPKTTLNVDAMDATANEAAGVLKMLSIP